MPGNVLLQLTSQEAEALLMLVVAGRMSLRDPQRQFLVLGDTQNIRNAATAANKLRQAVAKAAGKRTGYIQVE